jgi:glycosyltransferase involved in cell wall biosynthesis
VTGERRCLCVLPDLSGGGAQRTMINLFHQLPEHGWQTELAVVQGGGAAADWLGPDDAVTDLGCGRVRHGFRALRRLLALRESDLVFATMLDANCLAALACLGQRPRPALVVRETNSQRARGDLGPLRRKLAGWAYRRADRVVALSHGVERELVEDLRLDAARALTLPNPVDIDAFAAPATDDPLPGRWRDGPVLVAAGRLTRQKGFDILLDAFARLETSSARLVILGEGPDRAALQAQAESLGLSDRILLPGFVTNPGDWYAQATLFVLSSRWEGFGHVLVEAMASGLPVLATDCPHGPRDIIDSGRTGLLVPPDSAEALAAAIDGLLQDAPLAQKLAAAGREAAAAYGAALVAGRYAALFDDLCPESISALS